MNWTRTRLSWSRMIAHTTALIGAIFAATAFGIGGGKGSEAVVQASSPWPGGVWTPGEATYGSKIDSQLSVPMSDGTILKVDVVTRPISLRELVHRDLSRFCSLKRRISPPNPLQGTISYSGATSL